MSVLVDTSVWVDHLRDGDGHLRRLLRDGRVLMHPYVVGELALGRMARRHEVLGLLDNLPRAEVGTDREVRDLVERADLSGRGIGYVDVHLLAATRLTAGAQLWTRDRRLAAAAAHLGVGGAPRVG